MKKYIMLSFEDERIESLSKVLGNKTCKKILEFLTDLKEASEKDIADSIKIPLNTVEYNLKILLSSGLVEKSKTFFWSKRGKKIPMYKISNKSIIISPKNDNKKFKTFVPAALISFAGAFILRQIFILKEKASFVRDSSLQLSKEALAGSSPNIMERATNDSINLIPITNVWIWFLIGALFTAIVFIVISWRNLR